MISEQERQGDVSLPEAWVERPFSMVSLHAQCMECLKARAWFRTLAVSHRTDSVFPLWILERWPWGPSYWPFYWCALPGVRELDCGVRSHLAAAALRGCGVDALQAQVALYLTPSILSEYEARWQGRGCSTDWIAPGLGYHEVVAILDASARTFRLWDPNTNAYLDLARRPAFRGVASVRIPELNDGRWTCGRFQMRLRVWHMTTDPNNWAEGRT